MPTVYRMVLPLLLLTVAMPVAAAELDSQEKAEGFVSLFNGQDLTGWVGDTEGYVVEEGTIVCVPKKGRNLYTEKEYDNFVIRFEFKLEPGSNNGLGIRCPLNGHASYDGMELQIIDEDHERYANLKDYQHHGSIYGIVAAKAGHLKPVGEWNQQEVIANGRNIKVILNGVTIIDANLDEALKDGALDGKTHPGAQRPSGHIGFLGHGDKVSFRNIRIKEL